MVEPLRTALSLDGTSIADHSNHIEALRKSFTHTIENKGQIDHATCVTYSLKLFDDPIYLEIATNSKPNIFAGKEFMEFLTNTHLISIPIPCSGALITYHSEKAWKHIGKLVQPDRVLSKWGTYPIYEHGIFEVPIEYGNEVRYYKPITQVQALDWFLEYTQIKLNIS